MTINDDVSARETMTNLGARLGSLFGFSDGMGKITGFIFASAEPVCIREICRELSLTKGTVSLYLRMLEDRKLIVQAFPKDAGRDKYYELNPYIWSTLRENILGNFRTRYQLVSEACRDSIEAFEKAPRKLPRKSSGNSCGKARRKSLEECGKIVSERIKKLQKLNDASFEILENILSIVSCLDEKESKQRKTGKSGTLERQVIQ